MAMSITAEGVLVGCMQVITEWQKFKLRKAGIHQNIKVNQTQQGINPTHLNMEKETDLVRIQC